MSGDYPVAPPSYVLYHSFFIDESLDYSTSTSSVLLPDYIMHSIAGQRGAGGAHDW